MMEQLWHKFSNLFFLAAILCPAHSWADVRVIVPPEPVTEGAFFLAQVQGDPGTTLLGVETDFNGRTIPFFADGTGYSALIGVAVDTKAGEAALNLVVKTDKGILKKTAKVIVKAGQFPSEILTVAPRKVQPLKKDLPRIQRETVLINKAYSESDAKKYWDPPTIMPIENPVTSIFGSKRVYNGVKQSAHYGTDLRAPVGSPIKAPLSGRVALAMNLFFTGNTIILDHGYGFFTIYGHMSKLHVKAGAHIQKGEIMGLSGATGRVSGPHLHWGVNLHGVKIDPMALVVGLR